MENKLSLTPLAKSISLIVGSSMVLFAAPAAADCTTYTDGICNLKEFQMTSTASPTPTAWYFTLPTQDAAINAQARTQNVYFASGTSSRSANDIQHLVVDGANLSGYYINASKNGTAGIHLVNNATVDWLEAGGSLTNKTNAIITVDKSTLNGANANTDYDETQKAPQRSKYYARGSAIYLSYYDTGDNTIDIRNGSVLNGRILTGSAGKNSISVSDSAINKGNINVAYAKDDITIAVDNSAIDTRDAAIANENAIIISGGNTDKTNSVTLKNKSQLTGSLKIAATGGLNTVTVDDSTLKATTAANAIDIAKGKTLDLTLANSQVTGITALAASDRLNAALTASQMTGDLLLSTATTTSVGLVGSGLTGSVNASALSGEVDLLLKDSQISGDVTLKDGDIVRGNVILDNAQVGGQLYGNANSTLTLMESMTQLQGDKFSRFGKLNVRGGTTLGGGFSDNNVGTLLEVTGGVINAPVALTAGKLIFNQARLIADSLSLRDSASLELSQNSQLETHSSQLFSTVANVDGATQFNKTGSRLTLSESTLTLTDDTYQLAWLKSVNQLLGSQSNASLVMTGQLINNDSVTGEATVTDAATAGAVLANVDVVADKNRVVVGSAQAMSDQEIAVANSFGAASLRLEGAGVASVAIVGGKSLTLTGASGGSLISVAGNPDAEVNVDVESGSLNLGTLATANTTDYLRGQLNIGQDGALNVVSGDHTVTSAAASGIVSQGEISIGNQAVLHANVELVGSGAMAVDGTLDAGKLLATADADGLSQAKIFVGHDAAAGKLIASEVDLHGASVFIDPQWQQNATIDTASQAAFGGENVNGRLTVGQNALLVLGDTRLQPAIDDFASTGLAWSPTGVTAALAVATPQTLIASQGGIRVDGSLSQPSSDYAATLNRAQFGEQSLLMVNSESTTRGNAALNATDGNLDVASSAQLYVKDAKANQHYTIAHGFNNIEIAGSGWQDNNLILNKLLSAKTTWQEGDVIVTTVAKAAQDVLPGVVTTHALDTMIAQGINDTQSGDAGLRFLSQAVESPQIGVQEVVNTVNSAAQLAVAAGVQATTLATGLAASRTIQQRMSLAHPEFAAGDGTVWVQALYGNQRARDFSAGQADYGFDTDYYGVMLGGEGSWDSAIGPMRTGIAAHAGRGNTDSSGDFNTTHNDFDFWGVSLYQNWRRDAVNVSADIGFSANSNDIEQDLPGWMNQGRKLNGDVDSQLLTAGLTAEYRVENQVVDVIPYAGVRYNQLKTKGFTTRNANHETVFKTDEETQNIWQFPAGVKLSKTFALDSGWDLSTQADVAVITRAGDTHSDTRIRAQGISATDVITANITDKTAFAGQLGMTLHKGDMAWGVGYGANVSDHSSDQKVMVSWQLTF